MIRIKVHTGKVLDFIRPENILPFIQSAVDQHKILISRQGKGNDFLGWIDLPVTEQEILGKIEAEAQRIRQMADVFVVVGIGGSYLGARAVIDSLAGYFPAPVPGRKVPRVVYAGHHLSGDYMSDLLKMLDHTDYAMAVISKSGTTTEPAVAFRILKRHIEKKYGIEGARDRIVAITDKSKGALKQLADLMGYSSYVVPDDVGGRYSVLSPVGLLPVSVAGVDIRKLLEGAREMRDLVMTAVQPEENPAVQYAAIRNALYHAGKKIEIMVNYEPSLFYVTEWWKQLFGESEGKEGKGIFPAGAGFTTDLHSMGQYIQDGLRLIFETVLTVREPGNTLTIPEEAADSDGLNYLAGKRIHEVNRMAETGTILAHVKGGVPNILIELDRLDENSIGQLLYFFEFSCALSGYILGVNPFDQPGVEAYKKNMFALLGKPGFEQLAAELRKKL